MKIAFSLSIFFLFDKRLAGPFQPCSFQFAINNVIRHLPGPGPARRRNCTGQPSWAGLARSGRVSALDQKSGSISGGPRAERCGAERGRLLGTRRPGRRPGHLGGADCL